MPVQIVLREDQLKALGVIRDLESNIIERMIDRLSSLKPPPIRLPEIHKAISELIPDRDVADSFVRQLTSLYTLRRGRGLTADKLIEGLRYGIGRTDAKWTSEQIQKWIDKEPQLRTLFSLWPVMSVVKAMDLSYDYDNLLQNAKIITDIRPVFNEEGSEVEGGIVAFTLRLHFDNIGGSESLSVALDEGDVQKLLNTCQRALKKAQTAQVLLNKSGVQKTFIAGGEE